MGNYKILIADDDDNICQLLTLYLIKENYSTQSCHNGKEAIDWAKKSHFDLILLDVMMPETDGYEALAQIREFSDVPIIMVSAKGEPLDKISGLDCGADDYVTKPFEPQELLSRIKALLRRTNRHASVPNEQPDIVYKDLTVSIQNHVVKADNKLIDMPPKEIELLYFLAAHPMQVFTREQLLKTVWGAEHQSDIRTVDVHIKRIRERLGNNLNWKLDTVWGIGYKFEVESL